MADQTLRGSLSLPLIVIVLVIVAGCVSMPQAASPQGGPAATRVPGGLLQTSMNISGVPLYYGFKNILVSVEKDEAGRVTVEYLGGRDYALVGSLKIDIRNSRDRRIEKIYTSPQVGQKFPFDEIGTKGADTVMVTAYFTDNTVQTIFAGQIS
jgi:hypothetical protein